MGRVGEEGGRREGGDGPRHPPAGGRDNATRVGGGGEAGRGLLTQRADAGPCVGEGEVVGFLRCVQSSRKLTLIE